MSDSQGNDIKYFLTSTSQIHDLHHFWSDNHNIYLRKAALNDMEN